MCDGGGGYDVFFLPTHPAASLVRRRPNPNQPNDRPTNHNGSLNPRLGRTNKCRSRQTTTCLQPRLWGWPRARWRVWTGSRRPRCSAFRLASSSLTWLPRASRACRCAGRHATHKMTSCTWTRLARTRCTYLRNVPCIPVLKEAHCASCRIDHPPSRGPTPGLSPHAIVHVRRAERPLP